MPDISASVGFSVKFVVVCNIDFLEYPFRGGNLVGRITISILSLVNTQYLVRMFSRVCLEKNVLVKSTRSLITLLLLSAQKDENSNELLVFFDLLRPPVSASFIWLALVVFE